jgi:hypothetical protein
MEPGKTQHWDDESAPNGAAVLHPHSMDCPKSEDNDEPWNLTSFVSLSSPDWMKATQS